MQNLKVICGSGSVLRASRRNSRQAWHVKLPNGHEETLFVRDPAAVLQTLREVAESHGGVVRQESFVETADECVDMGLV